MLTGALASAGFDAAAGALVGAAVGALGAGAAELQALSTTLAASRAASHRELGTVGKDVKCMGTSIPAARR